MCDQPSDRAAGHPKAARPECKLAISQMEMMVRDEDERYATLRNFGNIDMKHRSYGRLH